MESNAILIALIVAVPAIVSPLLLSLMTNRNRRLEKEQDYARLDMVAEKAEKAAEMVADKVRLVAQKAAEDAKLLVSINERVAAKAKLTIEKLDVIHALVNSNMTATMQSELDSHVVALALMIEIIELKRAAGSEPSVESLASIKSETLRVETLKKVLTDRIEQQKMFEKRIGAPLSNVIALQT